jgi:hypothetical protein
MTTSVEFFLKLYVEKLQQLKTRVVDPDWFNTDPDPDPAFLLNPDPEPDPDPS